MENYEYDYIVNSIPNEELYYKQCAELEKRLPGIQKLDELQDVDGSRLQKYLFNGKSIRVINDFYLNDVHVVSEIQLNQFILRNEE